MTKASEIVALVDLDDTLFQTLGKCLPEDDLTVAAVDRQEQPLSFMGSQQRLLLNHLLAAAKVIPVTARNMDAYHRVKLDFNHGAILCFGGLILDQKGQVDEDWLSTVQPSAKNAENLLKAVANLSDSLILKEGLLAKARLVGDKGLTFYLVIKTQPGHLTELDFLGTELKSHFSETNVYLNGNNLAVLPKFLDKALAAEYFLKKYIPWNRGDYLLLGLGDSLSDRNFLSLCDYVVIPTKSQLGRSWL
ncbi:MAG: hypothetical protein LBS44_03660 [Deltaproteobacteria bacterium]|jgi:hypothetical protein|nr:hypothetical protein [Deltaproteobacteria bacterium]